MTTNEAIANRHEYVRRALDGARYLAMDSIGKPDGDINDMAKLTGLPRVHRAESDSDVAVYSDGFHHSLVADANGPIEVRLF